jgi:hypothetical protein
MNLISLIGEQPIPNLLPSRHLKPEREWLVYSQTTEKTAVRLHALLPGSLIYKLRASAYDLPAVQGELESLLNDQKELAFNLTGGTKIMVMAGGALAQKYAAPFYYFDSEDRKSQLTQYIYEDLRPRRIAREVLPELISTADYLNAHLSGFQLDGFSKQEGGAFEQAVARALQEAGFEVLAGVRPQRVKDQIEIDLVIRKHNQVGIAEVKLGGGEAPKKGIDQLNTAAGREYLGTYTRRMLITARRMSADIKTLAGERSVKMIELPGFRSGQLSEQDRHNLIQAVENELLGSPHNR